MSSMVEDRIEVGTCDLGNVFIFHRSDSDGETWMVRAGNHTIGTYRSADGATNVARALCGTNVDNAFIADNPEPVSPEVEEYVEEVRKKVSKK